jgi:GDP-L-fucose synthase
VDDLADACMFVLEHYTGESHLNVGSGQEVTIADFAHLIAEVVNYKGELVFDTSRPDGTPRKLLDSSKLIGMGWRPRTSFREGLERTYSEFIAGNYRVS